MQIIQITEPVKTLTPTVGKEREYEVAIGIDFGTTHSLVAYSIDGKPFVIDSLILPSVIGVSCDGEVIVGDAASHCSIQLHSVKRLLAKKLDEIPAHLRSICSEKHGEIYIELGGQSLTPVSIAAKIIAYLRRVAEAHFSKQDKQVKKAVITVPAYFDDNARNQIRIAAEIAGLEVLRLISEPTAAGYAYGLDKGAEGKYIVFDFGGGTFDVSLINMQMGVFQVVATAGDNNIGGDDVDWLIAEYLIQEEDGRTIDSELLMLARRLKEGLSEHDQVTISGFTLTITELEAIMRPLVSRLMGLMAQVIDPQLMADIKGIILAGGSTRLRPVRDALAQKFPIKILKDIDPDKVVAYGAAIQAENLVRKLDHLLIDVTPLSLGIEIMGGTVDRIIERNTPIPTSVSKDFTTYVDGQSALKLHIVQGEREMVDLCRSLATIYLVGIPNMPAGIARITVTFSIDADGLLTVTAYEKITGAKQEVRVKPSYGISRDNVISMLKDAFENAENDHHEKLLNEAKVKAEALINTLEKRMVEFEELLDEEEVSTIMLSVYELQKLLNRKDRDAILTAIDNLEVSARPFIERCFSFAAQKMLIGTKV